MGEYGLRYKQLLTTAARASARIQDGDAVIVPSAAGEPPRLLEAMSSRRTEVNDVTVSQILAMRAFDYFDEHTDKHIRHTALFLGTGSRPGAQQGWVECIPAHFSEIPSMIRRQQVPADVVLAMASPMDSEGYFAIGLSPDYTMAAISRAREVVLEVNPNVPHAHGGCRVHVSQVTAVIEDDDPVLEAAAPAIGPVQQQIAAHVADLVPDGSTLQIGYGGIPDAVVRQLLTKNDLGIHTEMLGDGLLDLIEAGVVTNARKNVFPGRTVATFAFGSKRLYDFMDDNPAVEMHPADIVNDPYFAGQVENLHAINGSLQIDLTGQCGSETLGPVPFSGTGGQSDFVRAANRSLGGKAIIVLPSTAKQDTITRIVPTLSTGTHVSTHKNDVDYVVTEYGVAQLHGKSVRDRARSLIEIAHPAFRHELTEQAHELRLL